MAAVLLFRDTKLAAMTSCENTLDATEFAYLLALMLSPLVKTRLNRD